MQSRIRLAIIVSQLDKAISHEWILEGLLAKGYTVHFIMMNPSGSLLEDFLVRKKIPFLRIPYHGKWDIPTAIWKIYRYLKRNQINVVHAHLFEGGLAGITAAKLAGVKNRIYSRHHSSYHHDYYPAAVKYDRLINRMSTAVIAASKVSYDLLVNAEKVNPAKIHLIHHGFYFDGFESVTPQMIKTMKSKYNITGVPVVGVIAKWTKLKGIRYIIEAFSGLLKDYPSAQLVLANTRGDDHIVIQKKLDTLGTAHYRTVVFEPQFETLFKTFDVFVHVPINLRCEAFGQVYVEALAAGIPSVFTMSGIATEFVRNEENAFVVPFMDSKAIENAIRKILNDPEHAARMAAEGKRAVMEKFRAEDMIDAYEKLYLAS